MQEHHIPVRRTARYLTLGDPGGEIREVWIACHGYRQLAGRFLRHFEGLDDGTRLIVAPEALSRFYLDETGGAHGPEARVGATWMTREDRRSEIADYVDYLDALCGRIFGTVPRAEVRLHVLGFSQGAATASRWAVHGDYEPDHLVLWAGGLPPDLDPAAAARRLEGLRVTLVAGDGDEHLTAEALAAQIHRLRALGALPGTVRFTGGHRLDRDALARVAGGEHAIEPDGATRS